MLKQLEGKNFRTHKYIKLDFVKGINCIIGKMKGKE
jgi:AAA15 family ATPase/GTPase